MAELGRPTKYKEEYNEQAYKLCLLGHTDEELASFFEIATSTLYEWKLEYPDFSEAIKKGKEIADMDVAEKLLDKAMGATTVKQTAIKMKDTIYNSEGRKISEEERIEVVDLMTKEAPDTTALIFWLKNRKSTAWRDKQVTEHEGGITIENKSMEDIFK
jgi:transposase-like protein